MNPLDKLLQKDEHREAVLRALGSAHTALDDAVANYRLAFKAATSIGWSKADLTKAGFPDPTRLSPPHMFGRFRLPGGVGIVRSQRRCRSWWRHWVDGLGRGSHPW